MIYQTDVGKRVAVLVEGAVSFKGTVDAVEVTEYSFWLRDAVFVDLDRKVVSGPLVRIRMDSVVAVTPFNEEDKAMQVAAGSGETGDAAPAVETAPSEERVAPKRFYSIEAAAKHWAAPMGIVMRPGGYLHSSSADTYQDLPEWLRGIKGGLSEQIHRLYRRGSGSVCGWAQLGMILLDKDLIYTTMGPRGARQFYVRS